MVDLEEPDKGRAWVVAFAACIINMILSGLFRVSGIVYVAVLDDYRVTRADATLPFTVRISVSCLSGPLVGILGDRFGIRTVTFCGGVTASAGAALCYFAPNMIWLTVFWGGIHGLGYALTIYMLQVVVNQHFQKYLATASGIAFSGSCVGSLVFPILVEWILDTYGLSGMFLLLGGIVMHALPPSIMLRPPQWVKYPQAYARLWNLKNPNGTLLVEEVAKAESLQKEGLLHKKMTQNMNAVKSDHKILASGIFSISEQIPNKAVHIIEMVDTTPPTTSSDNKTVFQSLKKIAKLYLKPMYVLISVCMAAYMLISLPIITVLVDYGKDKGFAEFYGKYFINVMAIADFIGRLCFGWVTDKKLMTTPSFMCLTLVLQGIFIVLFPFASSISFFIVLLVLYSITAGSTLVLFPILIPQYVDVDAQSVAMACMKFLSGIISFGVPSMIGHFRDEVGSYDGMFYLTGLVSIVCGGMWVMEPIFVKYQHGSKGKSSTKTIGEDPFKKITNNS